jgi:hypothetical protein
MLQIPRVAIGRAYVFPNGGLQPPDASGIELSVIQNLSCEFSGKGIELRGQQLYPIDARVVDVSGKLKFSVGEWSLEQLNSLFFGSTLTTGAITEQIYADEPHTVGAASPPGVVTVDNPVGFEQVLCVANALNGSNLTEIPSGTPAQGQYTVSSGGGFQFSSADDGLPVLISYISAGTGAQLEIVNNLQAQSPKIGFAYFNAADGSGAYLPNVVITGLKPMELKRDAFAMCEVDGQVLCPFGQPVAYLLQSQY